jgi:aspartyl-tRNA synthetase
MRIPFEIKDLTPLFAKSEFKAFAGKTVRAFAVPQAFDQPRSWFDNLQEEAKKLGAPGLAYVKVDAAGEITGPIAKFMVAPEIRMTLKDLARENPDKSEASLREFSDSEREFADGFKKAAIPYLVQAVEPKLLEKGNEAALKVRIKELIEARLTADKVPQGRTLHIKILDDIINQMIDGQKVGQSVIFFSADPNETKAAKVLGAMRVKIAEQLDLIEKDVFKFAWIVDYPMYEMNEETKAVEFSHNPFSMPQGGLEALEKQDPLTIFAYQYDLVCNGYEIASGAIRNHRPETMYKAFALAGHDKSVVDTEFAGMINAFKYGAPPHGGIAPGIDRIVMLLSGETSIREVIAFPMAQNGRDLLMNAPAPVSEKQLRETHLTIRKPVPKV